MRGNIKNGLETWNEESTYRYNKGIQYRHRRAMNRRYIFHSPTHSWPKQTRDQVFHFLKKNELVSSKMSGLEQCFLVKVPNCLLCKYPIVDGGFSLAQVDAEKLSCWKEWLHGQPHEFSQETLNESVCCGGCLKNARYLNALVTIDTVQKSFA
jgi:hypothetical protein